MREKHAPGPFHPAVIAAVLLGGVAGGCTVSYSTAQGNTISPDGASYAYKVPQGFFVEDKADFSGMRGEHMSGVNFQIGAAVIRVSEQTLTPAPVDIAKVQEAFVTQASQWQNPATGWKHLTVAGAPALEYHLAGLSRDGKHQETTEYAVFNGPHLVYVSCNWIAPSDKSHALDGCAEVLKSLRLEA